MYGIMRIAKYKRPAVYGIQQERCRESTTEKVFAASDIDKSQTCYNVSMVSCDGGFNKKINDVISRHGCNARKDSVVMIGCVCTASADFFNKNPDYVEGSGSRRWLCDDKAMSFFSDCLSYYVDAMCDGDIDRVLHARIDFDETTPHLQIYSVPIVEKEDGGYKLCAKDLVGNRTDLRKKQDLFHEYVGKPRGLSRGDKVDWEMTPADQKRHKETSKYRKEQFESLVKEIDRLKAKIAHIGDLEAQAKEKYDEKMKTLNDAYKAVVGKYSEACETYNRLAKKYNADLEKHNKQVDEIHEMEGYLKQLQSKVEDLEQIPAIQALRNENKIKAISKVVVGVDEFGNAYTLNELIDAARKHSRDMDEFQSNMSYIVGSLNIKPIREIWDKVCGIERDRQRDRVI